MTLQFHSGFTLTLRPEDLSVNSRSEGKDHPEGSSCPRPELGPKGGIER